MSLSFSDIHDELFQHLDMRTGVNFEHENRYAQVNLVSDGSVPAKHIDPNLINPWGISFGPTSPFWVADNGTGLTTVYDGKGNLQTIAGQSSITIATPGQTSASPTGTVFNSIGHGFDVSSGRATGSSVFLFATEDGTISGWSPNVNAGKSTVLAVDNSKAGASTRGWRLPTPTMGLACMPQISTMARLTSSIATSSRWTVSPIRRCPKATHPSTCRFWTATYLSPSPSRTPLSTMTSAAPAMASSTSSAWKGNCYIEWRLTDR